MTKKHLNAKQIKELAEMIKSGKTNADVANYYNVSVATVNNHRTRLKREGISLPTKRGRRAGSTKEIPKQPQQHTKEIENKTISPAVSMEQYKFIINGVLVTVSGKTKNVHIGKESMIINF